MSIEFLIAALIVVLLPGTGVVYTVAVGMGRGRAASVAAAFGCTLGILPAILAAIFGLSAILHAGAIGFTVLKYAGAAYLVYLAWRTWRGGGPLAIDRNMAPRGAAAIARTGFLINVLNPKLSAFFLAFLPQFLNPGAPALPQMLAMSATFMAMTFAVFLLYGALAAAAGARALESPRVMDAVRHVAALAFAAFGLRLALSRS